MLWMYLNEVELEFMLEYFEEILGELILLITKFWNLSVIYIPTVDVCSQLHLLYSFIQKRLNLYGERQLYLKKQLLENLLYIT
jgi:hypothetical protein